MPRRAIAVSAGRAAARVGEQQQHPGGAADQPGNHNEHGAQRDQRAVGGQPRLPRSQPGSQPRELALELRTRQRHSGDKRGQQQQESPAQPDRRRQRHYHGELDEDVDQKQSRHHEMATSGTAAGVPSTTAARLDG